MAAARRWLFLPTYVGALLLVVAGKSSPPSLVFGALLGAAAVALGLMEKRPLARGYVLCVIGAVGIGLATVYLSGPQGGAGKFVWFLRNVLHLDPNAAAAVNYVVRKSVHLVTYGALAACASVVVRALGFSVVGALISGYCWAVPHAVLDESFQAKTSTRTGSVWDVLLDIVGMSAFLLFWRSRAK